MAVQTRPDDLDRGRTDEYACPHCGGSLALEHGSWQCADCRYAPKHGAD